MTSFTSKIFTSNNTAVITGGSSGIGRATAVMCASKGMHVWIADIDEPELLSAEEMVKSKVVNDDQQVKGVLVDVSDSQAMNDFAAKVFADPTTSSVHFLMNNAGTGLGGGALSTSIGEFNKVLGVNTYGPINGCKAFVPQMKERGDNGLIVNTGSKQGITMPPGNLTYNVSKAALKAWTEGLEHELMLGREKGHGIRAALLIPGWVNTSIHLKEKRDRAAADGKDFNSDDAFFHEDKPAEGAWMPVQVVDFMLKELDEDKFYIVCPDNDVDRFTDNIRMTWTMQDITQDRPPLSRWHPDWKDKFTAYLENSKTSS